MDQDGAKEFVSQHHHAVLATRRRDGSPQLSPILVGSDADGNLVVSSRETAVKVRNLMRDPNYDLAVFTNNFFGAWISIRGRAQVVHLPDALPGLEQYYRSVSGEHPDWDEYRAAMVEQRRVLLVLSIEDVGPKVSG
ncbi:MAG: PPOX class F420-dependent oxidoreductase [Candidatus Dormiibacterota bacterium]